MPSDLLKNAIRFLQKKYPQAAVTQKEVKRVNPTNNVVSKLWVLIAIDPNSGVKQRAIAVKDIEVTELWPLANLAPTFFDKLDQEISVQISNEIQKKSGPISNTQMAFATKIIIYTNELKIPVEEVLDAFISTGLHVQIESENEMYNTLFISYGGEDEKAVSDINNYLKGKGISTWFFPDDALPGQKLHRMMHEGVNAHERFLLICSKSSLNRSGVLNEIERVLERESKEGGSDILIPVTLDDHVFKDWMPNKKDIAEQVRSRVVSKIDPAQMNEAKTIKELEKMAFLN